MWNNILFGFIIPWIPGVFLLKKDVKIFLLFGPLAMVVAFTFDLFGIHMKFWRIHPHNEVETFSALPMYFGVYPILAAYLVYFLKYSPLAHWIWIFIITLITTIIEFIGVLTNMVHYYNGWNIFWTFISYLLAYLICYTYYRVLNKYVDI